MTVKQLLRKLKSVPEDFEVVISNDELYIDGIYKTNGAEIRNYERQVEITSDHKYRWESDRWER